MIGAGILWFGWFGFNAGSAFAADTVAIQAAANTFTAGAAAMLSWLAVEKVVDGHATSLGAASGVVAGLVGITPGAGFMGIHGALAVGLAAGALCALAVRLKFKAGFDDALDVVGVHLVGGLVGGLLIGFFASPSALGGSFDGRHPRRRRDRPARRTDLRQPRRRGVLLRHHLPDRHRAQGRDGNPVLIADDELLGLDLSYHAEQAYSQ